MKKRLVYYLIHLVSFVLILFSSVYLYFLVNKSGAGLDLSYVSDLLTSKKNNFILIYVSLFLLSYLSGIFELKPSNNISVFKFLSAINLKFIFVVSLVSFLEFFIYFTDRVGRFVYVYIILLFAIYSTIFTLLSKIKKTKTIVLVDKKIPEFLEEGFAELITKYDLISWEEYKKDCENYNTKACIFLYHRSLSDLKDGKDLLIKKIEGAEFVNLINFIEHELERVPSELLYPDWIINEFTDLSIPYLKFVRAMNIFFSFLAMILLFPIGFFLSFINKIFYKGPILYRQERIGEGGRAFNLFKFRTMITGAEINGPIYASDHDKRITPIGKIMRMIRIDEVPQFINILKGEMNLIGPRPERNIFILELEKDMPYYKFRNLVKPGLTGWAQVMYSYAGEDRIEQQMKFEYDLFYIKNRNILLDMLILVKTVRSMFSLKGK